MRNFFRNFASTRGTIIDSLKEKSGGLKTVLAEKIIKEGQLFFTKWNLERIKNIPLSKESEQQIRKLSWSIEKATKG